MAKEMVISANPHETRVAIMEEGLLCEYYVEREKEFALVGSIYKGRVTRVLPGMQSSFVDIGLDSDAFLYVTDFLEGIEDLDEHVATTPSAPKLQESAGQPFAASGSITPAFETDLDSAPVPSDVLGAPRETLAPDTPSAPQVPFSRPPASPQQGFNSGSGNSGPGNRGRFENRGRPGRDSRRGGRGGNRFGNRRGGSGGGRSGEQRFGRELPSSKYASSGATETYSSEGAPAEGHVSIILPGESLAKYREKPAAPVASPAMSDAPAITFPGESPAASEEQDFSTESSIPSPAERAEPAAAPRPPEFRNDYARDARTQPASSSSSASGLEPLPGETISKWKQREPADEQKMDQNASVATPDATQHFEMPAPAPAPERAQAHTAPLSGHSGTELPHVETNHEDHAIEGLSEDEAAALAEHVAEAQEEEAEREAEERSFAAADEAAGAVHDAVEGDQERSALAATADAEHASAETEGAQELEDEEEAAETEGMIAPPAEQESEHDTLAAADEDDADADAEAQEVLESLEETEHALELGAGVEPTEGGLPIPAENPLSQHQQQPSKARIRDDSRARMQNPARRGGRDRGRRDDRGRRPQHGHGGGQSHYRTQARRPQLIADMLKQGQEIIVQIAKEPLGKKGARITSHVALPGRFLVYMPTLTHTGVSRKIASAEDRARLRHLVNDAKGSAGGGFIVRTAAGTAAPEEVRADVEFLTKTWAEIKASSEQKKAPSVLHRDLNLVERMLRDHMSSDYTAIWVDTEEEYTKVVDFMSRFQPGLVNRVKLYTKDTPVFEEFGIQQEIDKGLRPKVWLKSGGYIVINHTEALVAIDVNTGKFVGKGSNRLEDTIVRTNVEAVKEIVRQMRLRDLGGIIIIDFIDMEERRNREKVMGVLEEALKADRAPSKVLRFNEFGLVAITRKRTKQALERTLCQPCPYCTGSGMVKSIATLCYEIQTEARKMAPEMTSGSITLRVHPEIGKALKTRESSLIEELERWTKKSVIIQADPTLHWEQYDIY